MESENLKSLSGANLILAGAGTGKTTAIVGRILELLTAGAREESILAITFTNKAANEMKERVVKRTGETTKITCGTFHSFCLRLLKVYHKAVNIEQNFVILDEADKKKILKEVAAELEIDLDRHPIKLINFIISTLKNSGIAEFDGPAMANFQYKDIDIPSLYRSYQRRLESSNTLDFDDLILKTVKLLFQREDILSDIQDRFLYIFVDEYQDTNELQHKLINKLASKYQNITCVGDEDQSIYGWRGAQVKHILNFPKEFPNAKISKLEQNYRSTQEILNVAHALISNNKNRYEKRLFSDRAGSTPAYKVLENNRKEIEELIKDIKNLQKQLSNNQIAILVRSSFQTRGVEEGLINYSIPYEVVDGVEFYERKEVKDLLSYLKFIYNSRDSISFERMLSYPKRGIGEKKIEEIIKFCREFNKDIPTGLRQMLDMNHFTPKIRLELDSVLENIEIWQSKLNNVKHIGELVEDVYFRSGYGEKLIEDIKEHDQDKARLDNIKELINFGSRFNTLDEFLEHTSLVANLNKDIEQEKIKILTIHGAKGLEFEAIMIPNFEDEIIPNKRTIEENPDNLEEERRLLYVAITRAKNHLYIYRAKERYMFGKLNQTRESIFLKEVMQHLLLVDKAKERNISFIQNNANTDGSKYKYNDRSGGNFNKKLEFYKELNSSIQTHSSHSKLLKVGITVNHIKYGSGKIVKQMNNFYEIEFEDGLKRVIAQNFLSPA